jgi:hypothetical protein
MPPRFTMPDDSDMFEHVRALMTELHRAGVGYPQDQDAVAAALRKRWPTMPYKRSFGAAIRMRVHHHNESRKVEGRPKWVGFPPEDPAKE